MGTMLRALAAALALLWSSVAMAVPVIVGIEGYAGSFQDIFKDYDPVSMFYIYDSEATGPSSPPNPSDPFAPTRFSQTYVSTGYPYGIFGSVGQVQFAIPDVTISVINDAGPQAIGCRPVPDLDVYALEGRGGGSRVLIVLQNCDATAYDVSDFPMKVPPPPVIGNGPGEFQNVDNVFSGIFNGHGFETHFFITRIYRVPEPSTLALLGLGLAGLAFIRCRKQ